jgi:hypothetical protein
MDWFEKLTGFRETQYEATRQKLQVDGHLLRSLVNGKTYAIGSLELVSLQTLRDRVRNLDVTPGRIKVSALSGDVRRLHQLPEFNSALFQVASQFNLLEMPSFDVTPERGVTGYQHDGTQGPACAIAAGAATIYRNYFVPVDGQTGQTAARQLNGLADIGTDLQVAIGRPIVQLWEMRNGYALCSAKGLDSISAHLSTLSAEELDALGAKLRIGVQTEVEVTDVAGAQQPVVSQAFCSALPVRYTNIPSAQWKAFATLVLRAAYEATIWSGVLNARRGRSNVVLLTHLGGGVFGNDADWIAHAIRHALTAARAFDLDVRIVSHGETSARTHQLVADYR